MSITESPAGSVFENKIEYHKFTNVCKQLAFMGHWS